MLIGVYTWANGIKARFIVEQDEIILDSRIIFADDDFRLEYRGNVKDNNVMHGRGTLTLKGGKTYTGNWVNGELRKYDLEIKGL